jgi:hypothetical protein
MDMQESFLTMKRARKIIGAERGEGGEKAVGNVVGHPVGETVPDGARELGSSQPRGEKVPAGEGGEIVHRLGHGGDGSMDLAEGEQYELSEILGRVRDGCDDWWDRKRGCYLIEKRGGEPR